MTEATGIESLERRLAELVEEARSAGLSNELASALLRSAREIGASDSMSDSEAAASSAAKPDIPMSFGMIGDSAPMLELYSLLERVAPSNVSVLVQGETGTGKELVARALHDHSPRKDKPFLAENCAAVPAGLLESELFGHAKGSFTGAIAERPGHFVAADGGTMFLDEIGDMPLEMQSKLLRVLQDGELRPVGSNKTRKVDVRVVAATNKDLVQMCQDGSFRKDLYFRLNVINLKLPPLRDRGADVGYLAEFFLRTMGKEMGREAEFSPEALAALTAWRWPGNVRELQNEVQRALALSPADRIELSDLSRTVTGGI